MSRPWEYTSTRRVLMQAVLCGVLGVSVAIAWAVQRRHSSILLPAAWTTQHAGPLYFELPAKWSVKVDRRSTLSNESIDARETHGFQGVTRSVSISLRQIRIPDGKTVLDVATSEAELGDLLPPEAFEPIEFLGQKGVYAEVPAAMEPPLGVRKGFLYALAVLPSGEAVRVTMSGPQVFVPADVEVFKRIVRSIREASGDGQGIARERMRGGILASEFSSPTALKSRNQTI